MSKWVLKFFLLIVLYIVSVILVNVFLVLVNAPSFLIVLILILTCAVSGPIFASYLKSDYKKMRETMEHELTNTSNKYIGNSIAISEIIEKMLNGYNRGTFENETITRIVYKLKYTSLQKHFEIKQFHKFGKEKAIEFQSGYSHDHSFDYDSFASIVASDLKKVAEACQSMQKELGDDCFEKFCLEKGNPFPFLFLFTHKCKFATVYGEEEIAINAYASILFEHIPRIQSAFSPNLLHHIARVELSDSGINMEELNYEMLIEPGIVKGGKDRRKNIPQQLRERLLNDANHACEQCGVKAANGATLEIDHIVPISKSGSDDYENLQVLCATCNRKKGSKI